MVSAAFLEQAAAMSVEDRWVIVDTLLETLRGDSSDEAVEQALEGLRYFREHPEEAQDSDEFIAELHRQYL
ncbi:MAG: hypothetical protein LBK72_10990 [Bifidobacteriaceae bacterium]|jgi:hypothetical protein|nr:hypothetical protein [Bifidobacteriaceae bacterium]